MFTNSNKQSGYPVKLLAIHFTQHGCIFSTRLPDNSTRLHQNCHAGFPQGETGIALTQAPDRKDEIPARRRAVSGTTQ